MLENRDEILKSDDESLSLSCELEFFKGSGNGGQKRNKTSSAARVRLIGTEYSASDCTERSQHRNRAAALAKLRLTVAYGERVSPPVPPSRLECALDHPEYPLWLAHLLDIAEAADWELKPAAGLLGCTPTALVKKLARDPTLWQFANAARARRGQPPLKRP
ncbi:MAG: peptide chain release factor-like protein [Lentisphaeria bacterium]|nr:peptide chain release factor-like protein [Lentisphaeria bacterium]